MDKTERWESLLQNKCSRIFSGERRTILVQEDKKEKTNNERNYAAFA